jgi:uncharacterized protein (TIGR02231 family)
MALRVLIAQKALFVAACVNVSAIAQNGDLPPARSVDIESGITAVTVYPGRAAATRSASLELEAGLYDLRFGNLPPTIQPDTIQARLAGSAQPSAGARVLAVDYEQMAVEQASSQQIADADKRIQGLVDQIERLKAQFAVFEAQRKFLDDVSIRTASDAKDDAGTAAIDFEKLREQLEFQRTEREKLITLMQSLAAEQRELEKRLAVAQNERHAMAGSSNTTRTAIVALAVLQPSPVTIELTYLVANAGWQPTYNIRASSDGSTVEIEYDAMIAQQSGEDWNDVALTLSTAQPTIAANPPTIEPWYVDVHQPDQLGERVSAGIESRRFRAMEPPAAPADRDDAAGYSKAAELDLESALRMTAADAQISSGGPAVTYQLPRRVTVKTNAQKQQRTRIATISTQADFLHIAVPALTHAVYVRGELTNASSYQLLPGPASIFFGQDYIGPTHLAGVAPQGRFDVHFGIDQSVKATRTLLSRKTSSTGLFKDGVKTRSDYRIEIDNGAGKPITLELWDRMPVSRSDKIKIELKDLTVPLAQDDEYAKTSQPQGLLKWMLNVPADAQGNQAKVVAFAIEVSRDKDVETTPLPE